MSESENELRSEALKVATEILNGERDLLHGAGSLGYLARELNIDDEKPFDFLWAVSSDCSELPMSESDRFGRHPD